MKIKKNALDVYQFGNLYLGVYFKILVIVGFVHFLNLGVVSRGIYGCNCYQQKLFVRKRNSIIVNLILLYLQGTFYIPCLEYVLFSYLKKGKTIPNHNKVTCSSVIVSTKKGVRNEIYHTRI